MTNTNISTLTPPPGSNTQPLIENFSLTNGISIATHNIQGANNHLKLQNWIEHCYESNLHIITLTETKFTDRNSNHTNPLYFFFYVNFTPYNNEQRASSLGTALMVCKPLQPYIHDLKTFDGTALYIDFYFPSNKTRIISTYLPSTTNHPKLNQHTQEHLMRWFTETKNRNWNVLLLGDFDENQFRNTKFPLFTNLNAANAISLMDFHNITKPTWVGPTSSSQIENIWCTSDLLLDLDTPLIQSASFITNSDHSIVSTTWHIQIHKQHTPRNKKRKRKIYQYEKMSKENWEEFSKDIDHFFEQQELPDLPTDLAKLNKHWHTWSMAIKRLINKHIPFSFTSPKTFYALSLKAMHLHNALKIINKLLRKLNSAVIPPLHDVNNLLNKIGSLSDLTIPLLIQNDLTNGFSQTIANLKST